MESGGGGGGTFTFFTPPPMDIFLFFSFFTETRNSQMQVKKQKIFYNIKKSSVVGGRHVTEILSTFGQHGLRRCMDRKEVKTVPGGA